jgi:cytoskeletal protein CcmA (bactofilin family)
LKFENIFDASRKGGFFVPSGMEITGTFTADKPGKIAGTVNGNVFVKGKVTILKEAVIHGDIHASEVIVYGKVTGDIKCTGNTVLGSGAHIRGNISTLEIHVEKDSILDGVIMKSITETTIPPEPGEVNSPENLTSEIPEQKQTLSDENANSESWF